MATITFTEKLYTQTCCDCHMTFGVPDAFDAARREDHRRFFCPNGHGLSYYDKSEADKLREQLAAKDREIAAQRSRVEAEQKRVAEARAQRDTAQRSLSATKAVVTRTKKKIVAGRCPCCSHQFKDLKVHMATQHPAYDPEKAAAAMEAKA